MDVQSAQNAIMRLMATAQQYPSLNSVRKASAALMTFQLEYRNNRMNYPEEDSSLEQWFSSIEKRIQTVKQSVGQNNVRNVPISNPNQVQGQPYAGQQYKQTSPFLVPNAEALLTSLGNTANTTQQMVDSSNEILLSLNAQIEQLDTVYDTNKQIKNRLKRTLKGLDNIAAAVCKGVLLKLLLLVLLALIVWYALKRNNVI